MRSALAKGVKLFASAILTKKIIFKGRIAADGDLPAKILYGMEICIQRWLGECKKYKDRSTVNDHLVCFDEVFEMVMSCSLNVTLPLNFIKSPTKNPTVTPPGAEDVDGKGRGKGKKSKRGDGNEDRIIKNTAPINEFLMKKEEIWKRNFARKCSQD